VQAAQLRYAATQLDVGPPAGHVRRNGDLAALARPGDDLRLLAVANGVEDLMAQMLGVEQFAQSSLSARFGWRSGRRLWRGAADPRQSLPLQFLRARTTSGRTWRTQGR
jgi:hypothetical protein